MTTRAKAPARRAPPIAEGVNWVPDNDSTAISASIPGCRTALATASSTIGTIMTIAPIKKMMAPL